MLFNDKLYSPQVWKQTQVAKCSTTFRRHDLTCNSISNCFSDFSDWVCDEKVVNNCRKFRQVHRTRSQLNLGFLLQVISAFIFNTLTGRVSDLLGIVHRRSDTCF